MNGYDLSRNFWNWAFENPELMSPNLAAIYFFAVEHCNRLGGKEKFGFPSQMTMDAVGISKYQTYSKYLNQLVDYGFIKLIQKSKNQYSANIISIVNAMPKKGKALDKAWTKHRAKHGQSTGQSKGMSEGVSEGSIVKQYNKGTNKQSTKGNDDLKNQLIKNKDEHASWIESIYMRKRLKVGSIGKLLKDFNLNLAEQERNHTELKDYKNNFTNWLNTMERLGKLKDYKR